MKIGKQTVAKGLVFFFYAIGLFMLNGYCYFRWNTYSNKFLSLLSSILYYGSPFLLGFYAIAKNRFRTINKRTIHIMVYTLILMLFVCFAGTRYKLLQTSNIILLVTVWIFCQLDNKDKSDLFIFIAKVFAIAVLPSLIYYVIVSLGVSIPCNTLLPDHELKNTLGIYYDHYPFGLIMKQSGSIARYCGIFDEAGFVGTLSAFFVAAGYRRLDKRLWILLFIEGLLSLSLAFYVLFIAFLLAYSWSKGLKKAVGVSVALIVALLLFMNINFQNEGIAHIQSRIDLTSFFLFQDNRSTATTDAIIKDFINQGGVDLFVGLGRGASNANTSMGGWTYKFLLYDFGIIGFTLYIGFFIFYAWKSRMLNMRTMPFIVVFSASIYQRPYILTLMNVSIFITALVFISNTEERKDINRHRNLVKTT